MALTVTKIAGRESPEPDGRGWLTFRSVAFDASYPTGGEAISDAELGFSKAPDFVDIPPKSGYVFEYVASTKKIKVYVEEAVAAGGPLLEAGNTTDLSALTGVLVKAHGRFAG